MTFGNVIPERNVEVKLKICLFSNMVLTYKQWQLWVQDSTYKRLREIQEARVARWGDSSWNYFNYLGKGRGLITFKGGWLNFPYSTQRTHFHLSCLSVLLIISAAFTSVLVYVGSLPGCATCKRGRSLLLVWVGSVLVNWVKGKQWTILTCHQKKHMVIDEKKHVTEQQWGKLRRWPHITLKGVQCSVEVVDPLTSVSPTHGNPGRFHLRHTTETAWGKGLFYISLPNGGIPFLEMRAAVFIYFFK